jgi:hypothetical protein
MSYGFSSQKFSVQTQFEHYDRTFAMDTAFLNRVGLTSGWVFADYSFYPDKVRHSWIRRIVPFTFLQRGRDRIENGDEYAAVTGLRFSLTRQGFFRVDRSFGQEAWRGQEYRGGQWRANGQMQVFRWLRGYANFGRGRSLFYDEVDPFVGASRSGRLGATFQAGGRFSQNVEFARNTFNRPDTGERVYTVNVANTQTTYQFTKELALRGIVQYDSQRHRVLTDFLGSYDVRPGTVFYAGYGSLYQKRSYQAPDWIDGEGSYLTTRRGLFLKASYLFRF